MLKILRSGVFFDMINSMVKQKTKYKYNFTEPVGVLNALASIISLVALFSIIFLDPSLFLVITNGFYLILFAINAYFARARILGYVFPTWLNCVMFLISLGTILISTLAIFSVIS